MAFCITLIGPQKNNLWDINPDCLFARGRGCNRPCDGWR
jgi:hypothetical protein